LVTKRSICELDVVLPIEVNSIVDIRSEMRLLIMETCLQEVEKTSIVLANEIQNVMEKKYESK
jgi:hypothetical protein